MKEKLRVQSKQPTQILLYRDVIIFRSIEYTLDRFITDGHRKMHVSVYNPSSNTLRIVGGKREPESLE